MITPGALFREALHAEKPLQIVGTINPISALLAKKSGFSAIYLSGAGVANASFGLPDLGITNLNDVLDDAKRITSCVPLPLLVDIDTGFGSAFNIERTIRQMIRANVSAVHIEDQVQAKRCGHRPRKAIVPATEMVDRLKAALDARIDPNFVLIARTDALAIEGLDKTLERIHHYIETGVDAIFFEGVQSLDEYQAYKKRFSTPLLANITEFGVTPLFSKEELAKIGVDMILYPLSAFRAMNEAALQVYNVIKKNGTQKSLLDSMQTRDELYELLHYKEYEEHLDLLFSKGKENE